MDGLPAQSWSFASAKAGRDNSPAKTNWSQFFWQ
jgi:hypothetical protein